MPRIRTRASSTASRPTPADAPAAATRSPVGKQLLSASLHVSSPAAEMERQQTGGPPLSPEREPLGPLSHSPRSRLLGADAGAPDLGRRRPSWQAGMAGVVAGVRGAGRGRKRSSSKTQKFFDDAEDVKRPGDEPSDELQRGLRVALLSADPHVKNGHDYLHCYDQQNGSFFEELQKHEDAELATRRLSPRQAEQLASQPFAVRFSCDLAKGGAHSARRQRCVVLTGRFLYVLEEEAGAGHPALLNGRYPPEPKASFLVRDLASIVESAKAPDAVCLDFRGPPQLQRDDARRATAAAGDAGEGMERPSVISGLITDAATITDAALTICSFQGVHDGVVAQKGDAGAPAGADHAAGGAADRPAGFLDRSVADRSVEHLGERISHKTELIAHLRALVPVDRRDESGFRAPVFQLNPPGSLYSADDAQRAISSAVRKGRMLGQVLGGEEVGRIPFEQAEAGMTVQMIPEGCDEVFTGEVRRKDAALGRVTVRWHDAASGGPPEKLRIPREQEVGQGWWDGGGRPHDAATRMVDLMDSTREDSLRVAQKAEVVKALRKRGARKIWFSSKVSVLRRSGAPKADKALIITDKAVYYNTADKPQNIERRVELQDVQSILYEDRPDGTTTVLVRIDLANDKSQTYPTDLLFSVKRRVRGPFTTAVGTAYEDLMIEQLNVSAADNIARSKRGRVEAWVKKRFGNPERKEAFDKSDEDAIGWLAWLLRNQRTDLLTILSQVIPQDDIHYMACSIVSLADSDGTLHSLLHDAVVVEMDMAEGQQDTIFRGRSLSAGILSVYGGTAAEEYVKLLFSECAQGFFSKGGGLQICNRWDNRDKQRDKYIEEARALVVLCDKFFDRIVDPDMVGAIPYEVKETVRVIDEVARDRGIAPNPLIGGYLMLRLFAPAVANPAASLLKPNAALDHLRSQGFMRLSRILQHTANGTYVKESQEAGVAAAVNWWIERRVRRRPEGERERSFFYEREVPEWVGNHAPLDAWVPQPPPVGESPRKPPPTWEEYVAALVDAKPGGGGASGALEAAPAADDLAAADHLAAVAREVRDPGYLDRMGARVLASVHRKISQYTEKMLCVLWTDESVVKRRLDCLERRKLARDVNSDCDISVADGDVPVVEGMPPRQGTMPMDTMGAAERDSPAPSPTAQWPGRALTDGLGARVMSDPLSARAETDCSLASQPPGRGRSLRWAAGTFARSGSRGAASDGEAGHSGLISGASGLAASGLSAPGSPLMSRNRRSSMAVLRRSTAPSSARRGSRGGSRGTPASSPRRRGSRSRAPPPDPPAPAPAGPPCRVETDSDQQEYAAHLRRLLRDLTQQIDVLHDEEDDVAAALATQRAALTAEQP